MGIKDRISGRLKKAAGDLADDDGLKRQGAREELKADAKEDLQRAQDQVEEQSVRARDAEVDADRPRP